MDPSVRRFIRASLVWLGIGVAIGVAMALVPRAIAYRPAHVHANLLGFVSMMIFGVAYHVVPRFTGRPLHDPRLAAVHLWVANAGLAVLAGGWIVRVHAPQVGTPMVGAGGLASAVGAYLFIYNLWRTLGDGSPVPVPLRARSAVPSTGATR
jgi:heme/copper-type cytochrome/quinol oxidase subunit 1